MTKIMTAEKALIYKLYIVYDIEKRLEKILPKMEKATVDLHLKNVLLVHLEETRGHIVRLEKIFEILQAKPKKHASEGARGIAADIAEVLAIEAPASIKDALIAAAGRCAEHYEIGIYRVLIEQANQLRLDSVSILLSETLAEEKITDEKLASAFK